jgi:multicomponent Na+:H+ antiporter subunit E
VHFVLTWLLLAAFWLGLSGHFDAVHLVWGLSAVTLVSVLSSRLLFGEEAPPGGFGRLGRLALYLPWLLGQIALANVDVLLRVLGLREVSPVVVRIDPGLTTNFGRVALANSITLTPGTVTIDVQEDGVFLVHAISPKVAAWLREGHMVRRIRWVEGTEGTG